MSKFIFLVGVSLVVGFVCWIASKIWSYFTTLNIKDLRKNFPASYNALRNGPWITEAYFMIMGTDYEKSQKSLELNKLKKYNVIEYNYVEQKYFLTDYARKYLISDGWKERFQ